MTIEAPATPRPKRRWWRQWWRTARDRFGAAARAFRGRVPERKPFTLKRLGNEFPEIDQLSERAPDAVDELATVYLRAQRFLDERDQVMVVMMIRDLVETCLRIQRPQGGADDPVMGLLAKRTAAVTEFVDEQADHTTRRHYAQGLYLGTAISVAVLAIVGIGAVGVINAFESLGGGKRLSGSDYFSLRDSLVCIGGGAAGAAVSVLLRLSNIERIDYKTITRRTAAYRIVLGWFFAAALLFLVKGGIVTLFTDPTSALLQTPLPQGQSGAELTAKSWFFWGGLGFLAGFNERWVPNIVTRSVSKKTASEPQGEETPARENR